MAKTRPFLVATLLAALAASPALAVERPLTVTADGGVSLAGTLSLPDAPAPAGGFPAVLLVQGSGPVDRDGSLRAMPIGLLKQVADALARDGIASLRLDKRGMYANAAQLPKDQAALAAFFTWDGAVGDLAAEFAALKVQPEINGDRTGIVGHSEGGLLLLSAASTGKAAPKTAVLLSTPGRPLDSALTEQLRNLMTRQGAPAEVQAQFLKADQEIRADILATGAVPVDKVPPGLKALYPAYTGRHWQGMLALEPAGAAARLSMPVLALFGGDDIQVSAERDGAALRTVLAGRTDGSKVVTLPGLSHNLKPGSPGLDGPVDPAALATIAGWLKEKL